ncbi:MAG TPA: hypothetical protein PLY93_09880, partial [Turneriella sp.]|nr:hypothetical protein [Turneriella sp.]
MDSLQNRFLTMKNFYHKHPLPVILCVGFLLRALAAFYNYTPTAEDDYANVIEPALAHYQTGAPIQTEAYRLAFLPKAFYAFIQPLKIFNVTSAPFLVSWGFFILGCFSLLGIWAFYRLGGEIGSEKENMRTTAAWLYAAHFILPFFSTRAFQESLTLTTVPLALWFLLKKNARARDFLLGGVFLGLTVVFRFQVGILALTAFSFFVVYVFKKKITAKHLLGYITGGLLALFFLIFLDKIEGRVLLSTPLEYIRINYEGNIASASYGSAPWHTYITLLAAIFIPPFSLVLLYPFFAAFQKNLFLAINLVVFILLHSFIGNKLERFMLPVLPFFFLLTLHGLFTLRKMRIVRYAWRGFVVLNALILLPVTLSRSQLNTIDAAAYLAHKPKDTKMI